MIAILHVLAFVVLHSCWFPSDLKLRQAAQSYLLSLSMAELTQMDTALDRDDMDAVAARMESLHSQLD